LNDYDFDYACSHDSNEIFGCAPRWILFGDTANPNNSNYKVRAYIFFLDSVKERSIGLGRNLDVENLNQS